MSTTHVVPSNSSRRKGSRGGTEKRTGTGKEEVRGRGGGGGGELREKGAGRKVN